MNCIYFLLHELLVNYVSISKDTLKKCLRKKLGISTYFP